MHSVQQADKLPMQIHAPSNDIGGAFSDGLIVLLISFRWFTLPKNGWEKIANLLEEGYRMPKPQHVDDEL